MLKLLRPGAFLFALLCFSLPFLRLSCNNEVISEPRGYQLAFGQPKQKQDSVKTSKAPKSDTIKEKKVSNDDIDMQPVILDAFIALVLGLIVSLMNFKYSRVVLVILCLLAVSHFLYYYFDYKHQLKIEDNPKDSSSPLLGDNMKIEVRFLFGYWLSLGLTILAMILAIMPLEKKRLIMEDLEDSQIDNID